MNIILSSLLPVAFIIAIGIVAGRKLSLEVNSLSTAIVYIFAPALIIDGLYRTSLTIGNIAGIFSGFALLTFLNFGVITSLSVFLGIAGDARKSLTAAALLPNNGNIGLSIAAFAFGSAGLERAMIYMIASSIVLFGLTPALLGGEDPRSGLKLIFKLPLIWSIVIGLILQFLSISLPYGLDRALTYLGEASIPLALIVLGIQLGETNFKIGKFETIGLISRLILSPLFAYGVALCLGMDRLDRNIFILQSAMPVAVNTVVLVTRFGGDAALMARTVVVTTLAGFLSLSIVLWGLGGG